MNASDTVLDTDVVRAIAWCRVGGKETRPHHDSAFYAAEDLGLLAHDPIWRATPQGEGVLIALGLLDPTWEKERQRMVVLWAREAKAGAVAQFVAAWSDSFVECRPGAYVDEKRISEDDWRDNFPDSRWLFFTTSEEIGRP